MTSKQLIEEYLQSFQTLPKAELIERYISDQDLELKKHIILFETGLPGYYLEPQEILAEDNKVAVRFQLKGKHTGDLFGFSPSGNLVSVSGIIIYEVEQDKIVNHWLEADTTGLTQQIGQQVSVTA